MACTPPAASTTRGGMSQSRGRGGTRHGPALRRRSGQHHSSITVRRRCPAPEDGERRRDHHVGRRRRAGFVGSVPMIEPAMSGDFGTLMEWADACRRMGAGQCETRLTPKPPEIRRRGHRSLPHRAHVLRSAALASCGK